MVHLMKHEGREFSYANEIVATTCGIADIFLMLSINYNTLLNVSIRVVKKTRF